MNAQFSSNQLIEAARITRDIEKLQGKLQTILGSAPSNGKRGSKLGRVFSPEHKAKIAAGLAKSWAARNAAKNAPKAKTQTVKAPVKAKAKVSKVTKITTAESPKVAAPVAA